MEGMHAVGSMPGDAAMQSVHDIHGMHGMECMVGMHRRSSGRWSSGCGSSGRGLAGCEAGGRHDRLDV